jgi:hypothetical protein
MTISLHSKSHWLAASEADRYMKSAVLLLFLLACLGPRLAMAQEQQKGLQSGAPTGTYAPYVEVPKDSWSWPTQTPARMPPFTLELKTNGTYVAKSTYGVPTQDGDLVRLLPEVARGRWRWDAEKREFQLEPGDFTFYIKRFRVNKANPNRLVWGRAFLERRDSE